MANTQAMGNTAKLASLASVVDGKPLKGALYLASATTNGSNATYTATGEVSGAGYTAGGVSVTNATAAAGTTTAYWTPSASIVYTGVTLATSFDAVMLYDTGAANRNLGVFTFTAQTVAGGTFTLTMPVNDATTGLIRYT